MSEWRWLAQHGCPEQDHAGHAAAESRALLLGRGGQFRLSVWTLRQWQWHFWHEVSIFTLLSIQSLGFFVKRKCLSNICSIFTSTSWKTQLSNYCSVLYFINYKYKLKVSWDCFFFFCLDVKIVDVQWVLNIDTHPDLPLFVHSQPYMMCRQCPGYRKELSSALWICEPAQSEGPAKVPGEGPSTSSGTSTGHSRSHLSLKPCTRTHQQRNPCPSTYAEILCIPTAAPQEFRCAPQGSHLICTCCLQPMPDRRFEYLPPQMSPQHCEWPWHLSINVLRPTAVTWWFVVRSFEQVWCARNLSVMCTGAASGSVVTAALRISAVGFCLVKISV